jgi:hypothetical protein
MKRADFTGSGPFASFARKVCGLDPADKVITDYEATAEYAKAQDSGHRPESGLAMQTPPDGSH